MTQLLNDIETVGLGRLTGGVPADGAQQVNDRIGKPENFTRNDLLLAGAYWPILMQVAKNNQGRRVQDFSLVQYARLIDAAKGANPNDSAVDKAIPVSIGRTLDPINWFCRENNLPNLACLAVDAKGKPGVGYMRNNNWEEEKAAVAAHNWNDCDVQFVGALTARVKAIQVREAAESEAKAQAKAKKLLTEEAARKHLSDWWYGNPSAFTTVSDYQRQDILKLIRQGISPAEAVARVLGRKSI
jgi:hypothetical protein